MGDGRSGDEITGDRSGGRRVGEHWSSELSADERCWRERREERFRRVLESLNQGVVLYRADGSIEQANSAAERILGLTMDELLDRRLVDPRWGTAYVDGQPVEADQLPTSVTLRTGREMRDILVGIMTPDDVRRWLVVNTVPFIDPDSGERGSVSTFVDITDQRELNLRLQRSLDDLTAATRERAAIVSAISHDLRTPLAAVRIMAELLGEQIDTLSPGQRRDLAGRLRGEVAHIEGVLSDLVAIDRLSAGLMATRRVPVDVSRVVDHAFGLFAFDTHHLVRGAEAEDPVVQADPAQIERIVDNLISNALRHTPDGSTIVVSLRGTADLLELVVEDDGPGVPEADKERVFEPYTRLAADRPGTGIGLFLVRQFAEFHGGRAWCEDRPGGGARFLVDLPRGAS